MMVKAIALDNSNSQPTLKLIDYQLSEPQDEQVTIRNVACEVNFIDIYHRKGVYKLKNPSQVLGVSGVGYIEKVGLKINGFQIGDKVAYISSEGGGYAEKITLDQKNVFSIPKEVSDKLAASVILKGLTAHFLSRRTFVAKSGTAVLVHAAAGGVGRILTQWCNLNGALVIGTVGSEEKKNIALVNGCHKVVNYQDEDWAQKVRFYTGGRGVNCVYDSVGQATFDGSLQSLMKMGILVLYGAASGAVNQIDTNRIAEKSLFFTRPTIFDYKENKMELILSVAELFENIIGGLIKIEDPITLPLKDALKAHEMIESRKVMNSIVLLP